MKFYFILFVFFFCVFPFNELKSKKSTQYGKYPAIVYGGKENIPVYGSKCD